jgi:simple sugar transport system permease protein
VTALATYVLLRTRPGNWIFAVGGSAVAARGVGVPAARTKIALFMMVSTMAALVGTMQALRLTSVQANSGIGLEFEFIIAAVIGGCLLTGGFGSAVGAALGALIFGMAKQGIVFAGWDSDWFMLFLGLLLLIATLLNLYVRKRAEVMKR